mgnify:CR=1 FL=1
MKQFIILLILFCSCQFLLFGQSVSYPLTSNLLPVTSGPVTASAMTISGGVHQGWGTHCGSTGGHTACSGWITRGWDQTSENANHYIQFSITAGAEMTINEISLTSSLRFNTCTAADPLSMRLRWVKASTWSGFGQWLEQYNATGTQLTYNLSGGGPGSCATRTFRKENQGGHIWNGSTKWPVNLDAGETVIFRIFLWGHNANKYLTFGQYKH